VVQKLIESLRTRQQISLAVSALEPGFLALIKDLNGNHVVQRCLLCLSNEDNKARFLSFSLKHYILDSNIVHDIVISEQKYVCLSHSLVSVL